jgi:hypothetical protein
MSESTILVRIICEPTDRSIPPPTITNINPIALIVTKDICLSINLKLPNERKLGAMTEKISIVTSNINKGVYFLKIISIYPDRFSISDGLYFITVFLCSCALERIFSSFIDSIYKLISKASSYPKE